MKLILTTLCLLTTTAFAQSTMTNNTTQTDLSTYPILNKIKPDGISHFSTFAGPSFDGNSNPRNFDGTIDSDGTSSWHQISFQYKINKNTRFVINPRFTIERSQVERDNQIVGKLDNPVLGITTTWYQKGNFTFSGGINTAFATVTEGDREDGLEWNPGGFQALNFKLNNKLNVGSWFWARYRYFRNNGNRSRAPLFFSPYVSYSLSDKLTLQSFYQVEGQLAEVDTLQWDPNEHFNMSVIYQVNKALAIQPMVTVFRDTDFDLAQGNINIWFSGRFL